MLREEKTYNPKLKRLTQFFSKSKLGDLFNNLGEFVRNMATSYNFVADEYAVILTQKTETEVESKSGLNILIKPASCKYAYLSSRLQTYLVYSHLDLEEKIEREVSVVVSILKVKDLDMHCIRVMKIEGDDFLFATVFKDIKEFFGGHVNAKHPK